MKQYDIIRFISMTSVLIPIVRARSMNFKEISEDLQCESANGSRRWQHPGRKTGKRTKQATTGPCQLLNIDPVTLKNSLSNREMI